MCWSEDGDTRIFLAGNVKEMLERQWIRKKSYVM